MICHINLKGIYVMWKQVLSNTYLPQNSRGDVVFLLLEMVMPTIFQVWVFFIAWTTAVNSHSWLVAAGVGLALTAFFQIKWAELGEDRDFLPAAGLFATGVVSAAMVCWFFLPAHVCPIAIQVGWIATGILNVRCYGWFFGQPGVFESREFNLAVVFVLGPIYCMLCIAVLAFLIIGTGLINLLAYIYDRVRKPRGQ
jgi:hypothetical protein